MPLFPGMDGSTPPPAGTPSVNSSSNYLNSIAQNAGIDLNGSGSQMAAPTGSATQHFPYVYLGKAPKPSANYNPDRRQELAASGAIGERPGLVMDQQAQFVKSGNANIHHWAFLLALAGYAGAGMSAAQAASFAKDSNLTDVYKLHLDFLYDAADQYGHGQKVTPEQWLAQQLKYRLGDQWNGNLSTLTPDAVSKMGGSLAGTHTQTSKSVDYMSPTDAKGLIRGMLQQQLGRDPTQAEYEDFLATVHGAEAANPSVSTTTSTTDATGAVTNQNTVTHGGLSSSGVDQALYQKAREMPSWAIWQAMGTYAPALYQALDSAVPGA